MKNNKLFCVTLPAMEVYLGNYFFEGVKNRPPRKHIHPTYELVCVQKNNGMNFIIHPPLSEHFSEDVSPDSITSLLFTFLDTDNDDFCMRLKTDCDIEIVDTFGGAERIKALKGLVDDRIPGVAEQRIAELRLLFISLARAISDNCIDHNISQQTLDAERIARLEEYFNIRLQDPNCSKQQLAEELGVCERQLTRIIKNTYNSNFSEILRNSRLTLAEALLNQGNTTPEEIAEIVGFSSLEALQRAWIKNFKKPFHIEDIRTR